MGLFSALYSLILIVYALWSLRLTVVFRDDLGLGYLLALFDVALTLPLVVWGRPTWLLTPLVGTWIVGLAASVVIRSRQEKARSCRDLLVDPATGLRTSSCFRELVREHEAEAGPAELFGVFTVRVNRFQELAAYYGRDAAERSVAAVARRARRELGPGSEAFRLAEDLLALAGPVGGSLEASELAVTVSKAANRHLVEGRKVDSFVGYAVFPRDGYTADELVASAEATTHARSMWRPSPSLPASVARVSVAH
ncbi:MAG: diguanylate cyclase domain-containing protein [Thermoleophilia bacterium]